MAGDWIKMRTDLHTHPKVVRISSALRADRLRVIGGLHAVWSLFDAHAVDGSLDGYTTEALDDMIGFPGFASAMAAVGWLEIGDECLDAPRFDEHNGQSAKRRAMEAERKRSERKASACDADTKRTREEKRREEVNTPLTPQEGDDGTWDVDDPTDPPCEPADIAAEQPGKRSRKAKAERTTFATWLQGVKSRGEKPITEFKALWEYADAAGLPGEFIELAWLSFSDHYLKDERAGRKLYADWKGTFLNAVKGNYRKLWFWSDRDNAYRLTTVGQQFERALQAKEAA